MASLIFETAPSGNLLGREFLDPHDLVGDLLAGGYVNRRHDNINVACALVTAAATSERKEDEERERGDHDA